MTCGKCGYAMEAWDNECPRCGGKGLVEPAAKPAANKATNQTASQTTNQAVNTPPPNVAQAVADVKMPTSQADKYADIDRNVDLWWELIGGGIFLLYVFGRKLLLFHELGSIGWNSLHALVVGAGLFNRRQMAHHYCFCAAGL